MASKSYVDRLVDGSWRISGSRVSLASLVHAYWAGRSAEAIALDFPTLSHEQIHGALAYYLAHRAEIDRDMIQLDSSWLELERTSKSSHADLLQKLRRVDTLQQTP